MSLSNCGLPYYIGQEVDDISRIHGKDAEVFARLNNIDVRMKLPDAEHRGIFLKDPLKNSSSRALFISIHDSVTLLLIKSLKMTWF